MKKTLSEDNNSTPVSTSKQGMLEILHGVVLKKFRYIMKKKSEFKNLKKNSLIHMSMSFPQHWYSVLLISSCHCIFPFSMSENIGLSTMATTPDNSKRSSQFNAHVKHRRQLSPSPSPSSRNHYHDDTNTRHKSYTTPQFLETLINYHNNNANTLLSYIELDHYFVSGKFSYFTVIWG